MPDELDQPDEQRITALEWWALAFMVVCVIALVVVYLDVVVWNP